MINFNTLVPLIARDVLHEGVHGFGLLMASLGVGAVIGALALALAGPGQPSVSVVVTGALVVSGVTMALAVVRYFWLAAGALLVIGCSQIVFTASSNTTLQVTVPGRLRGRIMSLYALAFVGASPFGSFLVGAVAEKFGVPAACAVGGRCGFALVALLAIRWRRRNTSPEHPGNS